MGRGSGKSRHGGEYRLQEKDTEKERRRWYKFKEQIKEKTKKTQIK